MKKILYSFKKWMGPFASIFLIVSIAFIVWMLFFDANSWLIQKELNEEIEILKNKKEFYKNEIREDTKALKALESKAGMEAFAREKYNMKRKNEDIYIIEFDSINKTQ